VNIYTSTTTFRCHLYFFA